MPNQTIKYYNDNFIEIGNSYLKASGGISDYFSQFSKNSKILDIGTGSGRDLKILKDLGHDVTGIDPSKGFIQFIKETFPELKEKVYEDSLPNLSNTTDNYDGIVCSAVLMHLKNDDIFNSVFRMRELLNKNGKLLISFPLNETLFEEDNRFYNKLHPEKFILLCERVGFRLLNKWTDIDSLGREDRSWITLFFIIESDYASVPISIVESIINKDRKVATYKLALIRALSDIATNNYNSAIWYQNKVGIPIELIAEKWFLYYWTIFESDKFIPQIQGEKPNYPKPVAFRKDMMEIINHYNRIDGFLHRFIIDHRNKSYPSEISLTIKSCFQVIKRTLIDGPIKHSGGVDNDIKIFSYDTSTKTLNMSSDLWKEFVLMASWIHDASILRWAELTRKLSGFSLSSGRIIDLLTVQNIEERDVHLARKIFGSKNKIECVWSGQTITNFDIDHIIPFSLWYNNDLWNLLPAKPSVNNQKRDKLPTKNLIYKRKDTIVDYWRESHQNYENLFQHDASRFTGTSFSFNWENLLFNALVEAIEYTALKRGIPRWEP